MLTYVPVTVLDKRDGVQSSRLLCALRRLWSLLSRRLHERCSVYSIHHVRLNGSDSVLVPFSDSV